MWVLFLFNRTKIEKAQPLQWLCFSYDGWKRNPTFVYRVVRRDTHVYFMECPVGVNRHRDNQCSVRLRCGWTQGQTAFRQHCQWLRRIDRHPLEEIVMCVILAAVPQLRRRQGLQCRHRLPSSSPGRRRGGTRCSKHGLRARL